MRLERASFKAIKYAILHWHYSQAVPSVTLAYSVFNAAGVWCGVICYSMGANNRIGSPYGLVSGQVAELVRVALNGKQVCTSKALAASIRLLKRDCPLVQLLVSYADPEQQHVGTIYQATNWIYTGTTKPQREVLNPETGRVMHKRSAFSRFGSASGLQRTETAYFKLKYLYPLTDKVRAIVEALRKPYPKKPAPEAQTDERLSATEEAGGSIPTPALHTPAPDEVQ